MDEDDYVVTGSFTDPHTGKVYTKPQVIPEYWKGPIENTKRAPSWCASPAQLRQFSNPEALAALYPQTRWLSFDHARDTGPLPLPAAKSTIGDWDEMPANVVLRQNRNDGMKDPARIGYDFSLHVHQRSLASLMQALIASGAACLEFAAYDDTGAATPWKSLLETSRFAAFLPELQAMYPNQHVSVRVYPTRAPHIRTGIGNLTYMPEERLRDPVGGPLPISGEPYTLGIALPDLRIEFWVQDLQSEVELPVLKMYWNTVLGVFAKNIRACYKLDPLYGANECTSDQVNQRTVSGYYELFFDINSTSLRTAFENSRDNFPSGAFTADGVIGTTRGESAIVIDSTICQSSSACDNLSLSQTVPTLLSSLIQVFVVTRLQFMDMSLDMLYIGPDGPNDDGVGGGDYLALYGRLLGDLNVFDLLGSISLAPRLNRVPYMTLGGYEHQPGLVFNSNRPSFPVTLAAKNHEEGAFDSFTYRIDGGLWRTPIATSNLQLAALTEGEHTIEFRAINDSSKGAVIQEVPTKLQFRIDTLAPKIEIGPNKGWGWWRHVPVSAHDLQSPASKLTLTYSINGERPVEIEGGKIPLRGLSQGRHIVRVSAFDEAGNESKAVKELYLGWGGCNSSGDGNLLWLALALAAWALRRIGKKRRMHEIS